MLRAIIILFFVPFYLFAQNYPTAPVNYVTDNAQVLRDDEELSLNSILRAFEDSTSIQLFVYTATSLNGADMSDLCQEIFHNWKIGNKKTNNGVLIGIFVDDRKFRIHTGYGMEGVLPDLRTKKIQDEFMGPLFKQGDYYGGIYAGIQKLIYYSKNEYRPTEKQNFLGIPSIFFIPYCIQIVLLLIQCLILFVFFKGTNRSRMQMLFYGVLATAMPLVGIAGLIILIIGSYKEGRGKYKTYTGKSSDNDPWFSVSFGSSSDSSNSSSDSSFDGGGGGDSGGGGSDSSW